MNAALILKVLKDFFASTANARLVFLFGSAARDRLSPDSDIDIAVEFESVPDAFQLQALKLDLSDKLHREVDLIVLNQVSPILGMQVLKNGILAVARDHGHYCRFFTNTVSQYDDLKRVRRASEENILQGRIYA